MVKEMAVPAAPENPVVLAVLNVPLMIAFPELPNVTDVAAPPMLIVEFAAMVNVFEAPSVTAKVLASNKLPVETSPTEMLPVTFDAVIAVLKLAPLEWVLLIFKLL